MDAGSSLKSLEAENGIANDQKPSQYVTESDGSKIPSFTNLQTLHNPVINSKVEPYQPNIMSAMHVHDSSYHGRPSSNSAMSAEEKQFHQNHMSMHPEITLNGLGGSDHNYQPSPSAQIILGPIPKAGNLKTLDVHRMSTSRETTRSPHPSPISPSNVQPIQTTPRREPIVTQTKAEEVSQELAADVVQNLTRGSLDEIEQAIKARVLSLLNSDGSRKRKVENAGITETPDPKRRVSCDQCSKTMVRRCDLRYCLPF